MKLKEIIKSSLPARRVVEDSERSIQISHALGQVEVLVNPVGTINHGVVQIEDWVSWGGVKIGSWVAADSVVAGGVDAEISGGEITVDVVLEGFGVGGEDECEDLLGGGPG